MALSLIVKRGTHNSLSSERNRQGQLKLEKMTRVDQRENEPRTHYLVRVAINYLREVELASEGHIVYDDAKCDGLCLSDDLEDEFDIEMEN